MSQTESPTLRARRVILDALAALPSIAPRVAELAEALGRTVDDLADELRKLEMFDLAETWPDPAELGTVRVMLSAEGAELIGVRLSADGTHWVVPPGRPFPPPDPGPTAEPRKRGRPRKPRDPSRVRKRLERLARSPDLTLRQQSALLALVVEMADPPA
jgi:hypothetical protein